MTEEIIFWLCIGIIFYTYIGYAILLLVIAGCRQFIGKSGYMEKKRYEPHITLIIPAYNEADIVEKKAINTLDLDYPKDKLEIIWVTDGSTDHTPEMIKAFPEMKVLHENERRGKSHAMNRGLIEAKNPVVLFTDANTMLNPGALSEIVLFFNDPQTGCVTGEKRIRYTGRQKASGAGEGMYWLYESWIKKLESETGSVIGAAGEIFAIRRDLYEQVSEDTLLDDFTISLQILQKGYTIKYAAKAYGIETASFSIKEEIKRKTRIAAGDLQAMVRMPGLLNPFQFGFNAFKYISHKALRWTLVPLALPLVFIMNILICSAGNTQPIYLVIMILQIAFYLLVATGAIFQNRKISYQFLFAPYYICVMNYAMVMGFFRFITGRYSVKWQKAKRD